MQRYRFRISYELKVLAENDKKAREVIRQMVEMPDDDVIPEDEIAGIEECLEDTFEIDFLGVEKVELPEEVEEEEEE